MIEKKAYVVAKDGIYAWVEAERSSGCQGCAISQGCGTGAVANYLGDKLARLRTVNRIGAEIGDEVIVGIPESALIGGSFMLYTVPLLIMFLGAGLGETLVRHLGGGEGVVIWLGLGGLVVGFLGARCAIAWLQAKRDFEPEILGAALKTVESK